MQLSPRSVVALALLPFSVSACGAQPEGGASTAGDHAVVPASAALFDVSPPLAELARNRPASVTQPPIPTRKRDLVTRPAGVRDPVAQTEAATVPPPPADVSFEGIGNGFAGPSGTYRPGGAPPDPAGAIGPAHYFQIVNTAIAIFDRAGRPLLGPVDTNTLWSGFEGACETTNDGDGTVAYDRLAGRWVVSQFSVRGGAFFECVAVSQTGDPLGVYSRYAFPYDQFPDYPKLGVWPDAYYVTFNMFEGFHGPFLESRVCAYDRAAMLAGRPATQQCFVAGREHFSLLPSDLDSAAPPPPGSPNYLLSLDTSARRLDLFKFRVDWATPANSRLTGPIPVAVAPFEPYCCVPQADTDARLEALADRLMYRLAYRNFGSHESLVVNHSVLANGVGGIRWYELRNPNAAMPTVFQQGSYAPDTTLWRWLGSIAMDKAGNIGLGFTTSSDATHPSIHFTGRFFTDPPGVMGRGESVLASGTASQLQPDLGGRSRWGDYSSINIDPVDDCRFWFTHQYQAGTEDFEWGTRIGSFQVGPCETGPVRVGSIPMEPSRLEGGKPVSAAVILTNAAPAGGAVVTLSSSHPAVATVPASVTVPAGSQIAGFTINTFKTSTEAAVAIRASYPAATTFSATLIVLASPVPEAVFFHPNPAFGASTATGTVSLNGPAPAGGAVVSLTSGNTGVATVPASMTIAAGSWSATFTATLPGRTDAATVSITASYHGISKSGRLEVTRTLPVGNAFFDGTLGAPKCGNQEISCDTGGLIDGRGDNVGPELNQPNSLFGECQEGSEGSYHADESLDRLRITTVDGTRLAPGRSVRVDATVFASTDPAVTDFLDLYSAPDATNPRWTLIRTLTAPGPGLRVLSTTFTLPRGSLQAIRGVFRQGGSPALCGPDFLDESDDLVFATAPVFERVFREPEQGTVSAPLQIGSDPLASGGRFVRVPTGSNSPAAPPPDGRAILPFSVATAGSYRVWVRARAATTSDDSLWVRVDGGTFIKWNSIPVGTAWQWDRVTNSDMGNQVVVLNLTGGRHTLEFAYREDGAAFDRALVTNDAAFTPGGLGSPSPPTGISATPGDDRVTLSWTASPGATTYKIRRGGTGGPYPLLLATVAGTSFTDGAVENQVQYCYVIIASNSNGDGVPSGEVCATPTEP
jgi:hypothetical protein